MKIETVFDRKYSIVVEKVEGHRHDTSPHYRARISAVESEDLIDADIAYCVGKTPTSAIKAALKDFAKVENVRAEVYTSQLLSIDKYLQDTANVDPLLCQKIREHQLVWTVEKVKRKFYGRVYGTYVTTGDICLMACASADTAKDAVACAMSWATHRAYHAFLPPIEMPPHCKGYHIRINDDVYTVFSERVTQQDLLALVGGTVYTHRLWRIGAGDGNRECLNGLLTNMSAESCQYEAFEVEEKEHLPHTAESDAFSNQVVIDSIKSALERIEKEQAEIRKIVSGIRNPELDNLLRQKAIANSDFPTDEERKTLMRESALRIGVPNRATSKKKRRRE